jgi:hypothetical protein
VFYGDAGQQIPAASYALYSGYRFNTPGYFDVGVVIMNEDLPRSPVPILFSRDPQVGETAIVVGWGRNQNDVPATLRSGSTRISGVNSSLNGAMLVTPFAPPSSSVCQGDSGGPLLVSEGGTWIVAGITSATSGNACNTGSNFFQSVRRAEVRDFIREHVHGVIER